MSRDMEECKEVCDRVGLLLDGEMTAIGKPQHLIDR